MSFPGVFSRSRLYGFLAVVLLASYPGASLGSGGAGDNTVAVNVRFVNESGNPAFGLSPENVAVSDDRGPIPVKEVLGPDQPFDVGLVLDVSPSTHEIVDVIQAETSRFFHSLPEQSKELIITFDKQIYVDCDWTTDRKQIDEAIFELGLHKPGNFSVIYEALVVVLEQKFLGRTPRQVFLLFSDGVEIGSEGVDEKESLEVVRSSGVPVFVIHADSRPYYRRFYSPQYDPTDLPPTSNPPATIGGIMIGGGGSERDIADYKVNRQFEKASKYLRSVADDGRGFYHFMGTSDQLAGIYNRILEDLSQVYTLVIQPDRAPDGRFHSVRVSTTRDDVLAVPLTKGYWAR